MNKRFLLNRLHDVYRYDCHLIVRMAENAAVLRKIAAETKYVSRLKTSIDTWDKVAGHPEPKLKAVDIRLDSINSSVSTKIGLTAV